MSKHPLKTTGRGSQAFCDHARLGWIAVFPTSTHLRWHAKKMRGTAGKMIGQPNGVGKVCDFSVSAIMFCRLSALKRDAVDHIVLFRLCRGFSRKGKGKIP